MKKGLISFIILVIIFLIVIYIYTGFNFRAVVNVFHHNYTIISTSSISTTILSNTSNSINYSNTTTIKQITYASCNNLIIGPIVNNISNSYQTCSWSGGNLALWARSGKNAYMKITVTGQDNNTYINANVTDPCTQLVSIKNLPYQNYTISFSLGPKNATFAKNASCMYPMLLFNQTFEPIKSSVYTYVFNGDFGSGTYSGWNVTGNAFGSAPISISYANSNGCYPENTQWSGYGKQYFASTYSCSMQTRSAGNLTSSPFLVTKPFLNFQVIGYYSPYIYVGIIYNNRTVVKGYFNTYKFSNGAQETFMFRNVTIPLTTVFGKIVRIRITVNEIQEYEYIAVGNFTLSDKPASSLPLANLSIANIST
ncbi:MAG: hypothetical protein QXS81_02310 [Candidatus Micrarchaeaceae archaeon]